MFWRRILRTKDKCCPQNVASILLCQFLMIIMQILFFGVLVYNEMVQYQLQSFITNSKSSKMTPQNMLVLPGAATNFISYEPRNRNHHLFLFTLKESTQSKLTFSLNLPFSTLFICLAKKILQVLMPSFFEDNKTIINTVERKEKGFLQKNSYENSEYWPRNIWHTYLFIIS